MSDFVDEIKLASGLVVPGELLTWRPIKVAERPFAVDPKTGLMHHGGVFDVSRGEQLIGVFYTPVVDPPPDVFGYYFVLEVPANSGIKLTWTPPSHTLFAFRHAAGAPSQRILFGGRPVLRFLGADFSGAKPGKYPLRFAAYAIPTAGTGLVRRPQWDFEKTLFVTRTNADHTTNQFVAECPEGKIVLHLDQVGVYPWVDWATWLIPPTTAKLGTGKPPLVFPIAFTCEMLPATPFYGKLGPLPFEDPWWKVIIGILAAIFAALGAIFGKKAYDGGANWQCTQSQGVGSYQKSCSLEGPGDAVLYGVGAGLFGAIAAGLTKLLLSDAKDPFRIGEENTDPAPDEATVKETVKVQVDYQGFPNAAGPADVTVSWQFERLTSSGKSYTHEQSWSQHAEAAQMTARTSRRAHVLNHPVRLSATFETDAGELQGSQAYVRAVLSGPKGQVKHLVLTDETKPGTYDSAVTFTSSQELGHWDAYVFAQSVDRSLDSDLPEQAAQSIGGALLNQVVRVTDARQCTIEIVKATSFEVTAPVPDID